MRLFNGTGEVVVLAGLLMFTASATVTQFGSGSVHAAPSAANRDMTISDVPQAADPTASPVSTGFLAAINPSLRSSPSWCAYSELAKPAPFRNYEYLYRQREFDGRVGQLLGADARIFRSPVATR